jgi:hypothetical protein
MTTTDLESAGITERVGDRFAAARAVADAVLYEGNVLYPYRASARKNQLRWQFGVLAPRPFAEAEGSEAWSMRAECVVESGLVPVELVVRVRCLQLQARTVGEALGGGAYQAVASLEVAGQLFTSFDESTEQELEIGPLPLGPLHDAGGGSVAGAACGTATELSTTVFELSGARDVEELLDDAGETAGRLERERSPISGQVRLSASDLGFGLSKLVVEVENLTDWRGPGTGRDDVVRRSLVGVHVLMAVDGGAFMSLVDPPERARAAVAGCSSSGCFPVLVGPPERDNLVLAAPIILYDHPEIAPESQGDMCDATEIDEILALRTLTLTDEEKREARATDPRSAAIVDRVDDFPPEIFERLHGAIRSIRPAAPPQAFRTALGAPASAGNRPAGEKVPWWDPGADASVDPERDRVTVGRHDVGRGTQVRLHPAHGADAQDIFLAGRLATVAAVLHDVDGDVHLAVTIDDDPAKEMHEWQGRYRYFRPEEVEIVETPT